MNSAAITMSPSHTPIPREKGVPVLGCLPEFAKDPLAFFSRLMHQGHEVIEFKLPFVNPALIVDGDLTHQILVKEVKNFRKCDRDVGNMGTVLGKGLVTNNDYDHHKKQRKLLQPGFHFRRIQAYSEVMTNYTSEFIKDWQGGTRLISDDMFKLTMYIVCKTLFDTDMLSLTDEADNIGKTMELVQEHTNNRFAQLFIYPDWIPTKSNRALIKARKQLDNTIENMIEARRLTKQNSHSLSSSLNHNHQFLDKGDLMSMLLSAKYEDGSTMDTKLIMDELITLFAAGHETTSNTLSWTFHLLSQHEEIQNKLHSELDQVLQGEDPTIDHLEQLNFTEMVIKEAMRLLPPAWTLNTRQANKDITIGEYFFPKNKMIFISPYAHHHNPKYFEQPEKFDPERFSKEKEKLIPKHAYIPFGTGPRVCIGQSFAMMEAKIILASIVQRFRISPVKDSAYSPLAQITLSNKGGIKVNLEPR